MSATTQLVRTPMTPLEQRAAGVLAHGPITYPVACPDKRFARSLGALKALTDAQRAYLWRMVHRYRRQIPKADRDLVEIAAKNIAERRAAAEPGRARLVMIEAELGPDTNVAELFAPLFCQEAHG